MLGDTGSVEAGWLRGAAELLDQGEAKRTSVRAAAVWLEELAPETRARKASLLSAWVGAAEALRSAIHGHESERGPLVEALFPDWRGPSLRRHAEQALVAEAELERRLTSGYVARRLAEAATETALRPALEALDAARRAWAADRDRPALTGAEAEETRARLLAVAGETAHLLHRIRRVVRAALADRPDLAEVVFPRRGRPSEDSAGDASSNLGEQATGSDDGEVPAAGAAKDAASAHGEPARAGHTGTATEVAPGGPPARGPTRSRNRAREPLGPEPRETLTPARPTSAHGPESRPRTEIRRDARAGKARPVRRS